MAAGWIRATAVRLLPGTTLTWPVNPERWGALLSLLSAHEPSPPTSWYQALYGWRRRKRQGSDPISWRSRTDCAAVGPRRVAGSNVDSLPLVVNEGYCGQSQPRAHQIWDTGTDHKVRAMEIGVPIKPTFVSFRNWFDKVNVNFIRLLKLLWVYLNWTRR